MEEVEDGEGEGEGGEDSEEVLMNYLLHST